MGWRTTATRSPAARKTPATKRARGLLPQPVRTAQMETTGREPGGGEAGPRRHRPRGDVHDVEVGDVAVGEDDLVDAARPDQVLPALLREDGDAGGVERPGELRRVGAAGDVGDLRRREADDLVGGRVAEDDVEVVEIAAGGAQDEDAPSRGCARSLCRHDAASPRLATRISLAGEEGDGLS